MSQLHIRSMDNLPVEIFHRIFDHLDIETIFFSIRHVCRLFRSIVRNYDRFDFHVKIISKTRFDVLCRMISPQNVRSLTLQNNKQVPDQTQSFLSQIRLQQLTRLHSIHLFGIDEFQLNYLCKRIHLNLIKSFSIKIGKYDSRRRKTTVNHLSTVVNQPNLRNLHLNIQNNRISEISWPMNCSIECLTVHGDITFDNLVKIFFCSRQLHRLIIKEKYSWSFDEQILRNSFPPITSLILDKVNITIDQLESFLLLTPSLISLKIIGDYDRFDGKRWEEFLQVNLPYLNQFQFDITCRKSNKQTREDLKLVIQSYETPFWIEYKKWFVTGEFSLDAPYVYRIYSFPMCKSSFKSDFNGDQFFLSTSNEISMIENISQLMLRLNMSLTESMIISRNLPYFPNVTKFHIHFHGAIPIDLTDYLPRIINISQLIEVKLESCSFTNVNENLLYAMLNLLDESSKLSSLIIHNAYCENRFYPLLDVVLQILPSRINYLKIPIKEVEQIEMILQRCCQLAVLQLDIKSLKLSLKIQEWFEQNTINSIVKRSSGCNSIWIGMKKEKSFLNQKRIKFFD